jgi:hypothetical protein
VHGQNRNLLGLPVVAGNLAAAAVKDKAVGAVPGFDNVQPLLYFPSQIQRMKVFTDYVELKSQGGITYCP